MILAGGTGTRLWPYSRSMTPKQFLNLGSTHESLFQETCRRLETLIDPEKIYVVGSASHEGELQQQMAQIYPDYRPEQLLIEPLSRNTAPAILWGILQIPENQRSEPVVILASDHLIKAPEHFIGALKNAETLASTGYLVTFGIRPDRPETGYGYIKAGEKHLKSVLRLQILLKNLTIQRQKAIWNPQIIPGMRVFLWQPQKPGWMNFVIMHQDCWLCSKTQRLMERSLLIRK